MSSKVSNKKGHATDADNQIGANLRNIRLARGLTQKQLAEKLEITFQQLQKYEKGTNRIAAGRLAEICAILEVSAVTLLSGAQAGGKSQVLGFSENAQASYGDNQETSSTVLKDEQGQPILLNRQSAQLLSAFNDINDDRLQLQLIEMARAMAKSAK